MQSRPIPDQAEADGTEPIVGPFLNLIVDCVNRTRQGWRTQRFCRFRPMRLLQSTSAGDLAKRLCAAVLDGGDLGFHQAQDRSAALSSVSAILP
jgi:hypothetical protein